MEPTAYQLNSYLDSAYNDSGAMTEYQIDEMAEEAIEDEFMRVVECVDQEVLYALIKAIYQSADSKNQLGVLTFSKSLRNEIWYAARKMVQK